MFNLFFIWKHKKDVQSYIDKVYVIPPRKDGIRYALPQIPSEDKVRFSLKAKEPEVKEPEKNEEPTVLYSDRDSDVKYSDRDAEIKYSTRDTGSTRYSLRDRDSFDASLVSDAMRSYLQEKQPVKPLSSTTNLSFVEKLLQIIRDKDLFAPDIYKSAQMDRKLYSKIISNKDYKPAKDTVLALIFALKLSLEDAKDLLERAGFTLSHSIRRDIILEYFIKEKVYNLDNINAFLYNMEEKIIGRNI